MAGIFSLPKPIFEWVSVTNELHKCENRTKVRVVLISPLNIADAWPKIGLKKLKSVAIYSQLSYNQLILNYTTG